MHAKKVKRRRPLATLPFHPHSSKATRPTTVHRTSRIAQRAPSSLAPQNSTLTTYRSPLTTHKPPLMNTSKSIMLSAVLAFVLSLTAAATTATTTTASDASALSAPPSLDNSKFVAGLVFRPRRCYTRTQFCCYKYYRCGVHCRRTRCYKVRKCTLHTPLTNKCLKYVVVRMCVQRCHVKLCRRFSCSIFSVIKRPVYIKPLLYKLGRRLSDKKVEG